jgi:hypothetical protein
MTDFADHALEHETVRCIECGAALTPREQQRVLDDGIPALCTVHAVEDEAIVVGDDDDATAG